MTSEYKPDELLYLTRLAQQSERYEEMVMYASKFAQHTDLSPEERNLLSVAYKNVVGVRRAAWRQLKDAETKEMKKKNNANQERVRLYKKKIQGELEKYCNEVLHLLDHKLLPKASNEEARVFYMKMKGDYYRYIAEYSENEEHKEAANNALKSYEEATQVAKETLKPTHPIRLGLALNYSVFYYEIMDDSGKACEMAKNAFDEAISDLDNVTDETYKDSTLIMQLLRDNLTLWSADAAGEADENQE